MRKRAFFANTSKLLCSSNWFEYVHFHVNLTFSVVARVRSYFSLMVLSETREDTSFCKMPGRARVVRGRYGRLILERSKTLLNNVLTTTDDRELHCGRVGFSKAGKSLFSTRSFARGDAVIEYKEQVIKTQPNHEVLTL